MKGSQHSRVVRISVLGDDRLAAVILSVRTLDSDNRKQLRKQTKAAVDPIWANSVLAHSATETEGRVLSSTARVAASDQNVMLQSARVGRSLSGGGKPSDIWGGVEFGANRFAKTSYQATSKGGKRFTVKRRTQAQFRPYNAKGYVVYPAAADAIPRIASLWGATVVRGLHDALEGKRG